MQLAGRRVLVTGASRGIGEQLAKAFVDRGARVALVARSEGPLTKLAAELGGTAHVADLGDPRQVRGLVARVEADGGPVDVLVNNAGIDLSGSFADTPAEDVAALFHVNLLAPVELCRQAIPLMKARGRGHLVNISSMAGTNAVPGIVPYSASKAGLSHFTASLRAELKGSPVRTTLVQLGPVTGEMIQRLYEHPATDRAIARFRHLALVTEVPMDKAVNAVVDAVANDRRHVRLPKRSAVFPLIVEVPRRLTEVLLSGVKA
jgi:uncharacterized protein